MPPLPVATVQAPYRAAGDPPAPPQLVVEHLERASAALRRADFRGALAHSSRASAVEQAERAAGGPLAPVLQIDRQLETDAEQATRDLIEHLAALRTVRDVRDYQTEIGLPDRPEPWQAPLLRRREQASREAVDLALLRAAARAPKLEPLGAVETQLTQAQKYRRDLYKLQDYWRTETQGHRTHVCGRAPIRRPLNAPQSWRAGPDIVQRPDGRMSYTGLLRCRARSCPPCNVTRNAREARNVDNATALWRQIYKTDPMMMTLTVKHGWDDSLDKTGIGIRNAWRKFVQGRTWIKIRKRWSLEYICARDLTYGENGPHPHLHVLLFTTKHQTVKKRRSMATALFRRWDRIVEKHIGPAYVPEQRRAAPSRYGDRQVHKAAKYVALDLRVIKKNPSYICKIGLELAGTAIKHKGRTPLQVLGDARDGHEPSRKVYAEYETTLKGTRDYTWSAGMRWMRWQLEQRTAQDDQAYRDQSAHVAAIAGEEWGKVLAKPRGPIELLESAERGRLWLDLGALIGKAPHSVALTERGPPPVDDG